MLLAAILAQWQHPVASSEALDLLHWGMHTVTYRRIAMAINTANKVDVFFHRHLFACCLDGRWGNLEQVVAQWQCPVASKVALDMPHWVTPSVLPGRIAVAIKMANDGGAFVCHH